MKDKMSVFSAARMSMLMCYYHDRCSGDTRMPMWLYAIGWAASSAAWLMRVAVCRCKGHDWVDNGYAGPDGGAMEMDCRRCGAGFHHVLY